MKLKDQVAIITGGARGNGFAIAKALATEGCNVVLADICADIPTTPYKLATKADLDAAVKEIGAMGVKAVPVVCDVRSDKAVGSMVEQVMKTFGKVDIAVANAGITSRIPVSDRDAAAWDDTHETH